MTKYVLVLIALVFFFCGTVNADFYKWEDENGNVNITDYPPPAKTGKNVQVHKYDAGNPPAIPTEGDQGAEKDGKAKAKKEPDAILFTKNSCPVCDKAREFLIAKKVLFTEYNLDNNKEAVKKRKEIDDSEDVPFAVINRNQISGFSESVYSKALKLKP